MFASDKGARAVIFLAALGLAFGITGPKLYKMARIKGWVPGATVTQKVLRAKWVERAKRIRRDDSYFVSWDVNEDRDARERRVRVSQEVWQETRVGDTLDVIHVPGDSSPYLRNGIFVEPGQFVFDYVLLAAEFITAIVMLVLMIMQYRRLRAGDGSLDPTHPSPKLTPERLREMSATAIQRIDEFLSQSRQELAQLETQIQVAQTMELKDRYKHLAAEKKKVIDELDKQRSDVEERLNSLKDLQ